MLNINGYLDGLWAWHAWAYSLFGKGLYGENAV
jgi:hypothetical protein